MQTPPDIQALDKKPGHQWTPNEISRVKQWFHEPAQLRILWMCAVRYLRTGASPEDVEDAVAEFFHLVEGGCQSYKPGPASCAYYLMHVCFRRHCFRLSLAMRKKCQNEISLSHLHGEVSDVREQIIQSLLGSVQGSELIEELDRLLDGSLLTEREIEAFVLRFFHDMNYAEIAKEMQSPLGSVKGWLHRALTKLRQDLKEKGWTDE